VVLDHKCEPFSLGKKWIGVHPKEIRSKLGDEIKLLKDSQLRSVDETRSLIAKNMSAIIERLKNRQSAALEARTTLLLDQLKRMVSIQRKERETLKTAQEKRWQSETLTRQARYNKGLKGLIQFVTGKRRKIKQQNERETQAAQHRDEQEKDTLIFTHLEQRRSLGRRLKRLKSYERESDKYFENDYTQYREIREGKRDVFERNKKHEHDHSRGR